MSNEEKIKAMSRWELAEFIKKVSDSEIKVTTCDKECDKCDFTDSFCTYQIAEWMMGEADD